MEWPKGQLNAFNGLSPESHSKIRELARGILEELDNDRTKTTLGARAKLYKKFRREIVEILREDLNIPLKEAKDRVASLPPCHKSWREEGEGDTPNKFVSEYWDGSKDHAVSGPEGYEGEDWEPILASTGLCGGDKLQDATPAARAFEVLRNTRALADYLLASGEEGSDTDSVSEEGSDTDSVLEEGSDTDSVLEDDIASLNSLSDDEGAGASASPERVYRDAAKKAMRQPSVPSRKPRPGKKSDSEADDVRVAAVAAAVAEDESEIAAAEEISAVMEADEAAAQASLVKVAAAAEVAIAERAADEADVISAAASTVAVSNAAQIASLQEEIDILNAKFAQNQQIGQDATEIAGSTESPLITAAARLTQREAAVKIQILYRRRLDILRARLAAAEAASVASSVSEYASAKSEEERENAGRAEDAANAARAVALQEAIEAIQSIEKNNIAREVEEVAEFNLAKEQLEREVEIEKVFNVLVAAGIGVLAAAEMAGAEVGEKVGLEVIEEPEMCSISPPDSTRAENQSPCDRADGERLPRSVCVVDDIDPLTGIGKGFCVPRGDDREGEEEKTGYLDIAGTTFYRVESYPLTAAPGTFYYMSEDSAVKYEYYRVRAQCASLVQGQRLRVSFPHSHWFTLVNNLGVYNSIVLNTLGDEEAQATLQIVEDSTSQTHVYQILYSGSESKQFVVELIRINPGVMVGRLRAKALVEFAQGQGIRIQNMIDETEQKEQEKKIAEKVVAQKKQNRAKAQAKTDTAADGAESASAKAGSAIGEATENESSAADAASAASRATVVVKAARANEQKSKKAESEMVHKAVITNNALKKAQSAQTDVADAAAVAEVSVQTGGVAQAASGGTSYPSPTVPSPVEPESLLASRRQLIDAIQECMNKMEAPSMVQTDGAKKEVDEPGPKSAFSMGGCGGSGAPSNAGDSSSVFSFDDSASDFSFDDSSSEMSFE